MRLSPRLALLLAAPALLAFTPFTPVKNVCTSCPLPASDVVVLATGEKVPGTIVAENDDYWVVERHGELRAAEKHEVKEILWKDGTPRSDLRKTDQARTTNDVVLDGEIVEEQPGRFLALESRGLRYLVWAAQLKDAHVKGVRHALPPAPRVEK